MNKIQIETAQNVLIEYKVAGLGERIIAFILDMFVLIALIILLIIIESQTRWLNIAGIAGAFYLFFIPIGFYHLAMEFFLNGQSVGKMALKIRVVRTDGKKVNIGNYFIRWLFRLVDISFTSGVCAILTIVIGNRGQRLGDILAGTLVISTKATAPINQLLFVEPDPEYVVQFPEIALLTDNDIQTIKEVMAYVKKHQNSRAIEIANKTKQAILLKMEINTELKTRVFFETLIMDYTAYHSAKTPKF